VAAAVAGWIDSPTHHAILSDGSNGRIGCAERVVGDIHSFACILAAGPLPAAAVKAPVLLLPDTAMPGHARGPAAFRLRWVLR
jgi:hypothetical protein